MTKEILEELETVDESLLHTEEEVEVVDEPIDIPQTEPSRYPLHTELADFDAEGNCTLNIDFKDFDISHEVYFSGDDELTAPEYELIYWQVDKACRQSGAYMIDCFANRYTVRSQEYLEERHKTNQPSPTNEDIAAARRLAYIKEVDPLTAQISRLRDEEPTATIQSEINELLSERAQKVTAIKERYPYV